MHMDTLKKALALREKLRDLVSEINKTKQWRDYYEMRDPIPREMHVRQAEERITYLQGMHDAVMQEFEAL